MTVEFETCIQCASSYMVGGLSAWYVCRSCKKPLCSHCVRNATVVHQVNKNHRVAMSPFCKPCMIQVEETFLEAQR